MNTLPHEIQILILSYLDIRDLVEVSTTCTDLYHSTSDEVLWSTLDVPAGFDDLAFDIYTARHPLIKSLIYTNNNVISTEAMSRFLLRSGTYLTHLHLYHLDLDPNLQEMIVACCPNLSHLDLSDNPWVGDDTLNLLAHCPNLESLGILQCDDITDRGIGLIIKFCKLRRLEAGGVLNLRTPTIQNLVTYCSSTLAFLCLDGGNLGDDSLRILSELRNLTYLELQYCDEFTFHGLNSLKNLRNLTTLKLSRCYDLTSQCLNNLMSSLKGITRLHLNDCLGLDDQGLVDLSELSPQLQYLELSQSYSHSLTDVGIAAVLSGCSRLVSLKLKGLKRVHSFVTLLPVLDCPKLRYLYLGGCHNTPNYFLEVVAAYFPHLALLGHYAVRVEPAKFMLTINKEEEEEKD